MLSDNFSEVITELRAANHKIALLSEEVHNANGRGKKIAASDDV